MSVQRVLISFFLLSFFLIHEVVLSEPNTIDTNSLKITNAPLWLKRPKVEKITERIQTKLEWSIRKIQVYWYADEASFQKVHNMGPVVQAYSRRSDNSIHLGPQVNEKNFEPIFSHELVHVISHQKYRGAIPKWLEEGLATHLAKQGQVDYKWLARQTWPVDVTQMSHPFRGSSVDFRVHYAVSQALIEMIASKCNLERLIQLGVEKGMQTYLPTYCEIKDLNESFRRWINKKSS